MPLDIAIGVLLALLIHTLFALPVTAALVLLGIAAALLPDIDILTSFFGTWRHRTLTHYPIIYTPFILGAFLFAPLPYATLFMLGILAHFIHDTIGTGWGISWLWPFTNRRFLLFPDGERRKTMGTFVTWLPEDKPEWAVHTPHRSWVSNLYLRPSPTAIIEYGVLLVVLLTVAVYIW